MAALSITQIRAQFPDAINRVAYAGERVIVRRHNKNIAALVSMEDLRFLEQMEDQRLAEEALAVEKDPHEKWIPWEEAERMLDEARARRRQGRKRPQPRPRGKHK